MNILIRASLRLRQMYEGQRDRLLLPRILPGLDDHISAGHSRWGDRLFSAHRTYVSEVSSDDRAISLELARCLLGLCHLKHPRRVVDLGSGFSSFVFRLYAGSAQEEVKVWSVDDNPEWLNKTKAFLVRENMPHDCLDTWDSFVQRGERDFDLVLHDLGYMKKREETLPQVLALAGREGILILDDMHMHEYAAWARETMKRKRVPLYSLRSCTLDKFKRFSSLALADPGRRAHFSTAPVEEASRSWE